MKKNNGLQQRATGKDWTDECKFVIEFISKGEELATYDDTINKHNQKNERGTEIHVYTEILDHKKKGKKYFIIGWLRDILGANETYQRM